MTSADLVTTDKPASTEHLDQLTPEQRSALDALVQQLNEVQQEAVLQTAYSIGKLVLEAVFDGDVGRFRQKQASNLTWRALTEHPDLEVNHSALWYSVALHENFALLGEDIGRALSLRHHRLLAHVSDTEVRRKLAQRTLSEELTTRALETAIKEAKATNSSAKRGRKAAPEPVKRLGRAAKELEGLAVGSELVGEPRQEALAATQRLATMVAALLAQFGAASAE